MRRRYRSTSAAIAAGIVAGIAAGIALVVGTAAFWWSDQAADPVVVTVNAGLLAPAEAESLATFHGYLLADHDIDYRVVTARGVGDIDGYAVERFATLGVGGASAHGRGLLLVIDPAADLVRLEVGYSLEGIFPDAFVAYVEHRQMVPFLRRDRLADGILAATELIVTRADRAKANAGYDGEAWLAGSGGAGATTRARLGAGGRPVAAGRNQAAMPAGRSPEETLQRYFRAMAARNASPDLAIYTPASRRMLQGWVMTPAQMDNVVKAYRRCHAEPARFDQAARRAVIRYPIRERQCAPWFFEAADGATDGAMGGDWALDLTMMQRAIRFGRDNSWHFAPTAEHAYTYAFQDWRLDAHGYPRAAR